jgi:hypothetical protein
MMMCVVSSRNRELAIEDRVGARAMAAERVMADLTV